MGRVDYYHDPSAPIANSLVVGSSAVVADNEGRILLQRVWLFWGELVTLRVSGLRGG
jgi:hypothetical protein